MIKYSTTPDDDDQDNKITRSVLDIQDELPDLTDLTVMVTGATGFVGSKLVTQLSGKSCKRVIAIGRNKSKGDLLQNLPHVDFMCVDLTDKSRRNHLKARDWH